MAGSTGDVRDAAQRALIKVLEGGQEIRQGSHRLVRANLTEAAKIEREFNARAAAEENAGSGLFDGCYVVVFYGR